MQVAAKPSEPGGLVVAPSTAVDSFFEAIRLEQSRYLTTLGKAAASLRNEPGHLAFVAATQARLAQQFFDAQRLILERRAEVDAEVVRIARAAEAEAVATVKAARARAAAAGSARAGQTVAPRPANVPLVAWEVRSPRQEVAALGARMVRTMAEVEELATIIDSAFEPDEPDCVVARRQLTAMLDSWWTAERQEGAAAIDDAHARAAMRLHVAAVEAHEIAGSSVEVEPEPAEVRHSQVCVQTSAEESGQLVAKVLSVLDGASAVDLSTLLADLVLTLATDVTAEDGGCAETAAASPTDPIVSVGGIELDAVDQIEADDIGMIGADVVEVGPGRVIKAHSVEVIDAGAFANVWGRVDNLEIHGEPLATFDHVGRAADDFWPDQYPAPTRAFSRWWIPVFVIAPLGLAAGIFSATVALIK